MIKIIYEDNHVIVAEKPPMMLSQGDDTGDTNILDELKQYIKVKYEKPGNVYLGLLHRLDRPVGGLMVFAKTSKAASRLSDQIRRGMVNKNYVAVVHGMTEDSEVLRDYLVKNRDANRVTVSSKDNPDAKYCELEYSTIERLNEKSLVKIKLITGRSHQIRVQFSSRKHPLVGDMRYGYREKGNIALYAYSISFIHPVTKEKMQFTEIPNYGEFLNFNALHCLK